MDTINHSLIPLNRLCPESGKNLFNLCHISYNLLDTSESSVSQFQEASFDTVMIPFVNLVTSGLKSIYCIH